MNRIGIAIAEAVVASGADLGGADLRGADLRGADLRGADLRGADLREANLREANLGRANLGGADLRGANLGGADLGRADLGGADLGDTCLDPYATPNGDAGAFDRVGCMRRGYRTRNSPIIGGPGYADGGWYEAPWFSVSETECHPGLYVRRVREPGDISVLFDPACCHRAWSKWRVKRFVAEGGAQ